MRLKHFSIIEDANLSEQKRELKQSLQLKCVKWEELEKIHKGVIYVYLKKLFALRPINIVDLFRQLSRHNLSSNVTVGTFTLCFLLMPYKVGYEELGFDWYMWHSSWQMHETDAYQISELGSRCEVDIRDDRETKDCTNQWDRWQNNEWEIPRLQ